MVKSLCEPSWSGFIFSFFFELLSFLKKKKTTVFPAEGCSIFNKALTSYRNSRRDTWDAGSQAKAPLPHNFLSLLPPVGAAPLCINNQMLIGAESAIRVSRTRGGHPTPSARVLFYF